LDLRLDPGAGRSGRAGPLHWRGGFFQNFALGFLAVAIRHGVENEPLKVCVVADARAAVVEASSARKRAFSSAREWFEEVVLEKKATI
jgi:hypothetical protein